MKKQLMFGTVAVLATLGCTMFVQPRESGMPAPHEKVTKTYAAVQTIFMHNCMPCHGAMHPRAGINLTSYAGVMKGGEDGPIVKPKKAAQSVLIMALLGKGHVRKMPFGRPPLKPILIKSIAAWINAGAKNTK